MLVQGKIIKDAYCDTCAGWQPVMRTPQLMELIGLEPVAELPIDPPF